MNSNKCGERIKQRLLELNMCQADLCRRTGINRATMSQYISGKYYPTQKRLEDIANALSTTPAYLMGWAEEYPAFKQGYSSAPDITTLTKLKAALGLPFTEREAVIGEPIGKIIELWLDLSDEAQQQLIQYAEFLLSKEDK